MDVGCIVEQEHLISRVYAFPSLTQTVCAGGQRASVELLAAPLRRNPGVNFSVFPGFESRWYVDLLFNIRCYAQVNDVVRLSYALRLLGAIFRS